MQTGTDYDFYRCQRCYRLLTQLEIVHNLEHRHGQLCPCGAMKIAPVNLQFKDMVLPRVWRFAWVRFRDIGLAGMKAELRADIVRWALKGQRRQLWATCELGTANEGPVIVAESVSLARALVTQVRMPDGQELHITGLDPSTRPTRAMGVATQPTAAVGIS